MRHFSPLEFKASARSELMFPAQRFLRLIAVVAGLVLFLGYIREAYVAAIANAPLGDLRFFALFDVPNSVINWVQSFILLFAAVLLATAAGLARRDADRDWKRWAVLSGLFVYLSMDETANTHQFILAPLQTRYGADGVVWMLPCLVVVAGFSAYLSPMLIKLPRGYAVRFLFCGSLFVGGAIGLEIVSQAAASHSGIASLAYVIAAGAEETLETAGTLMFCHTLLSYLGARWSGVSVRID